MSMRTIIEINHDYINIGSQDEIIKALSRLINARGVDGDLCVHRIPEPVQGVKILARRHHTTDGRLELEYSPGDTTVIRLP